MTYEYLNPQFLASFGIPTPKSMTFTYILAGASNDDNVATVTYKGEVNPTTGVAPTLGVLTYVYFGSTNNVQTITRTS